MERCLVGNSSRGLAEDGLSEDGEHAAASALADGRADCAEVVGIGRDDRRQSTVEVGNAQNISCAALRVGVKTRARDIDLTLGDLSGRCGESRGGQEGKGNGEELHLDGLTV